MEMAKIFVVDDEPHIVRLCQVNLQKAGHNVVCAYNGLDALEKIQTQGKPDLLILDIAMPKMNGIDVLRKIKNDPEMADLLIIILTAEKMDVLLRKTPEDDRWLISEDPYIEKPFDASDFLMMVNRSLDNHTNITSSSV